MKKRNTRRPVMVGIFVFLAIVLFIIAILTLGGQQSAFSKTISIYAIFDNVEGLKAGNNVWFSGVKIGVVKQIRFHGKSDVQIMMNIEEGAQDYIRKDARVVLSSESFIGNKLIEIVGGTVDHPPVDDGDYLKALNMAGTGDIMKTLQENNRNVLDITEDLKLLSSKAVEGKGLLGALFYDDRIVNDLQATLSSLQQASATAEKAMLGLNSFTLKLNDKNGLVNELLTDTTVYSQMRTTLSSLQRSAANAEKLTANLEKTGNKLNETDNAAGMLLNDEKFAQDMRTTMTNLQKSTAELNKSLEALQGTFLLRRQVRKLEEEKNK